MLRFLNWEVRLYSDLLQELNQEDHRHLPEGYVNILEGGGYNYIPKFRVLEIHNTTLIWVRGTRFSDPNDVCINTNTNYIEVDGGLIHEGYYNAAMEILKIIEPLLDTEKTITCIGHSLGGAVASVLAYLLNKVFAVRALVFGVPPVFSENISERIIYITTIINKNDVVPKLGSSFDSLRKFYLMLNLGRTAWKGKETEFNECKEVLLEAMNSDYPTCIPGMIIAFDTDLDLGQRQNAFEMKDVIGVIYHPFSKYHNFVKRNVPYDTSNLVDLILDKQNAKAKKYEPCLLFRVFLISTDFIHWLCKTDERDEVLDVLDEI